MATLKEFFKIHNLTTSQTATIDGDEGSGLDADLLSDSDFGDDTDLQWFDDPELDDFDGGSDSDNWFDEEPEDLLDDEMMSGEASFDDSLELEADADMESIDSPEDETFGESEPVEEDPVEEDPDFQGIVRTVAGACLVYKRKNEDGSYDELWIYNVGTNMRDEVKIRRAILSGTDIQPHDVSSPDGTQRLETTTIGNVQYISISGLPN